ncbi:MAG TPA: PKD domain-containing protein [Solirubrobacteraceae bacterium]|jgi:hypothetical protein
MARAVRAALVLGVALVLRAAPAQRAAFAVRAALALRAAPALRAALALIVVGLLALAPMADAEPGFEYGEVTRFGGFDSSAYNGGQYGGPLTAGKFLDPTGFAVDPQDNTVYVVDRTSARELNPRTAWRIQEFSPQGVVLGTTTFTLPDGNSDASAIEGLAVDHHAGRLYALVVGSPPVGDRNSSTPVAQELLAWLTTPKAGGLVAATAAVGEKALTLDDVSSPSPGSPGTVGSVISGEPQLLSPGATPLYSPQGIAVDPLEVSGVDDPVAIEASDLSVSGRGSPIFGDTIVQQVASQQQGATTAGELLSSWSGASLAGTLGASWGPRGLSTDPDGSLTVLLDTKELNSADVSVIRLKADFSEAVVLNGSASVPPLEDSDEAPMYIDESPFFTLAGARVSDLKGAGSQIVHLSAAIPGSEGPYASVFFPSEPVDTQVSSSNNAGSQYWRSGESSTEGFEANLGVRLLEPGAGGAITDLHGGTIVNTLGNQSERGPCNISAPYAALAAGAEGKLWVLNKGPRAAQPNTSGQGREVIELAPSAGELCPQPAGTFTMTPAGGSGKSGEETLTVPSGTQVTFDTSSINRRHGKPFAYEWDIDGDPTNGAAHDGFEKVYEMRAPHYYYPPSKITHMYTSPGEYKVRVRMRTDYGVYTPPQSGTVIVTPALTHPEARFTVTPSGAQQVTFNASGSAPGVGTIVNYHWNWGDGSEEDEDPQTPVVAHAYAAPGEYQVTLTVTNSAYQSATSAPQAVTVTVRASAHTAVASPLVGPLNAIPLPGLYPIPPGPVNRAPTRLSPHVRFRAGALNVTLACPATKTVCAGIVDIETVAALAAKAHKGHKKPGRLLLGHAAFRILGGHGKSLKMHLSARGAALLTSRKRLSVLVVVTAHDPFGDPGTATVRMLLRAPVVHRRGR